MPSMQFRFGSSFWGSRPAVVFDASRHPWLKPLPRALPSMASLHCFRLFAVLTGFVESRLCVVVLTLSFQASCLPVALFWLATASEGFKKQIDRVR